MRNSRLFLAAFIPIATTLQACDLKSPPGGRRFVTREETVTLQPQAVKMFEWTSYRYNSTMHIFCPLDKTGLGDSAPLAGFQGMVGYFHEYDPGTQPLPCDRRLNSSYRTAVMFDLSAIRAKKLVNVKSAQLYFRRQRRDGKSDCAERVLVATEDWTKRPSRIALPFSGFPAAEERYSLPVPGSGTLACAGFGSKCAVPVTKLVNDWVMSTIPNHGVQVAGQVETLTAKDNVRCVTDYGRFELQVTFAFDTPV